MSGPLKSPFAVWGHIVQCKAVSAGLSGSKSKLANVAMGKMGQIRRTPKWLRYLCHFDAAKVDLIGPDPNAQNLKTNPTLQAKPISGVMPLSPEFRNSSSFPRRRGTKWPAVNPTPTQECTITVAENAAVMSWVPACAGMTQSFGGKAHGANYRYNANLFRGMMHLSPEWHHRNGTGMGIGGIRVIPSQISCRHIERGNPLKNQFVNLRF